MKLENRSLNKDLQQGTVDGLYKSIAPDRGGAVELSDPATRSSILPPQYGITDYNKGVHPSDCGCNYCY